MLHPGRASVVRVPAGFQDIEKAHEVAFDVGVGIGDAVADTRLSGQVDHHGRAVLGKQAGNQRLVGDVALDENPFLLRPEGRFPGKAGQAVFLDPDIIIIVERIDTDDTIERIPLQEAFHEIGADETGRPRD